MHTTRNLPKEVEEIIGITIEVEPLDETPLGDLGLNTYNHDLPLSSRKVPSFDKHDPQPQPLPNFPPLEASLGNERGLKPPINPHSPDSFRMRALDNLNIHIPPSSLVTSFHLRDLYCYYHPCIDDPKKFLIKNEEEIFTVRGDGVGIKPDGVASPAMLYLTRRNLEVLRKFHWTTPGGRSNQLSHVSSPLLSKPGEY
ncbi:hypothetical protein Tco_1049087 [Tanacetum coccineum]